jgi:hypothetical protein
MYEGFPHFESQESFGITKELVINTLREKGLEDLDAIEQLRSWQMQEERKVEQSSNDVPGPERSFPGLQLILDTAEIFEFSGHEDAWRDTLWDAAEQASQAGNEVALSIIRQRLDKSKLVIE